MRSLSRILLAVVCIGLLLGGGRGHLVSPHGGGGVSLVGHLLLAIALPLRSLDRFAVARLHVRLHVHEGLAHLGVCAAGE
jgi:hypothetical protein